MLIKCLSKYQFNKKMNYNKLAGGLTFRVNYQSNFLLQNINSDFQETSFTGSVPVHDQVDFKPSNWNHVCNEISE